jgi:tetratricopeptide (TPR) repeat protein
MVEPGPTTVNERVSRAPRFIAHVGAIVVASAGKRAVVWAALLAGLAGVLCFVPLFDVLGYDFGFALGMAAAFACVDVGQGVASRTRAATAEAPEPRAVGRQVGTAVAISLGLLMTPLLLSLANGLRVRNCNLLAGLGFFALLPVGTALFAAPAGVLAGLLAPRRGRLLAWALPAISLAWTGYRLYADPAVFAFDPFGGYFPGPIYDEALRPPLRLLHFRLTNLVWIGGAVTLAMATLGRGLDPRRWRRWPLAAAVPLVAAGVVLFAQRGPLGFHIRRPDLEAALDRTMTTEHFVLRYASSEAKTPADLELQAEDLEFRYHQLVETLGVEPAGPVTVWEFPSAELKKELVGAGRTLYARPWTREIFFQSDRFPAGHLRHELAHVFAGAFGDRLFGIALAWRWPWPIPTLAMGLVEGVAEAADASDPDGASTIHQEAAAMIADGLAPPLSSVVGAGFTAQSGARAYTLAGSFTTFLLETRGAERLRALYRSAGNFGDVYRVPFATLEDEWRRFLAKQRLSESDKARASEHFRRPAIFKKVCARELAARVAEARGLERVEPARAVRLLEDTCRDDPHEPTFRLELAQARAFAGDQRASLEGLGRIAADADVTRPLHAAAASLAAEIHFHARDYVNAVAAQRRALELATEDGDLRLATVKLRALESASSRETLGRALFGDALGAAGADPVLMFHLLSEFARLHPTERLGPYLVGRQLLARAPEQALPFLRRACDDDVAPSPRKREADALPPLFERECRRMVAEAAYRLGDFERARVALTRLAAEADDDAEQLRALDMRARVTWAAGRRAGPVGAPAGR